MTAKIKSIIFLLLIISMSEILKAQQYSDIIHIKLVSEKAFPDSLSLGYLPIEGPGKSKEDRKILKRHKNAASWTINVKEPIYITIEGVNLYAWVFEPGDSIIINHSFASTSFMGRGSEKFRLRLRMDSVLKQTKKPSNPTTFLTKSVADYLEWHSYLQRLWEVAEPILEKYKDSISFFAWRHNKISFINNLEKDRHDKFRGLYYKLRQPENGEVTEEMVCNIYDTTFFTPQAKWVRMQPVTIAGKDEFIRDQVYRKYKFSPDAKLFIDPKNALKREALYYDQGKMEYNGMALEEFYKFQMTNRIIEEMGLTPQIEEFLNRYYGEPGSRDFRAYVKKIEEESRKLYDYEWAPIFTLPDRYGRLHNKREFENKLVLLNFGYSGCENCNQAKNIIKKLQNTFKGDSNFVIINISVDAEKDTWIRNLKYDNNSDYQLDLFAGNKDSFIIKSYNVNQFPALRLIDAEGRILLNPTHDPFRDYNSFVTLLEQELTGIRAAQWVLNNDGPYILSANDTLTSLFISNSQIITSEYNKNDREIRVKVHTDKVNQDFDVALKKKMTIEPCIYEMPEKLMAFSDIEGNFAALRQLLQNNRVIDKDFNWTFGKGHLVFAGDMFDRGEQVTECLWLIYSLEEKAKKSGGYVHFILGNHEIMNLSGDIRYRQKKYSRHEQLLNKSYVNDLFGKGSELGRWLRTKNIAEKIGDLLFIHAGISEEVNNLGISIEKMNELARPFYDKEQYARKSPDKTLSLLYSSNFSPFWFRNYYLSRDTIVRVGSTKLDTLYKPSMALIDGILSRFQVKHIIAGHTIIKAENKGRQISAHYNGKVINTDTRHKEGWTEALLIERNKFYRVNKEGEKRALFDSRGETNLLSTRDK